MRLRWCTLFAALAIVSCSAVLGLPDATTHMVPMRDGTELSTDVYLPDEQAMRRPTVLIRTTYDKAAKNKGINVAAFMSKPFTDAGYAVVWQDTRGRSASAGTDSIFLTDGAGPNQDGYDTVEWVVRQAWSDGRVGMYGSSALGITTYMAAASGHPALVCAYVAACGSNLYHDVFYPGGVFRQQTVDQWVTGQGRAGFLPFIYEHSSYDHVWERVDLTLHAPSSHTAIYQWGGWFDVMSQGQTEGFRALQEHGGEGARGRQMLVMGPWSHGGMGKQGDMEFPENAKSVNPVSEAVAWFDSRLKGVPTKLDSVPPVRYYLMGAMVDSMAPDLELVGNVWMTASAWPPEGMYEVPYFLHMDGSLSPGLPITRIGEDSYEYDPEDPVPTKGGLNLYPPIGPADMRDVEARPDVLSFTTPPLAEPVAVAGKVRVKLFASSTARDTDFMAMLCDVYPDGRSLLIADGAIRARHRESVREERFLTPGEIYEFDINLWDTAIVFNVGHGIRVNITSSDAPKYQPNPNTATPFHTDSVGVVATNGVYSNRRYPSALILPVIPLEN